MYFVVLLIQSMARIRFIKLELLRDYFIFKFVSTPLSQKEKLNPRYPKRVENKLHIIHPSNFALSET